METTFAEKVYQLAQKIPKGKVATYGQLAKLSGSPLAFRAVGAAMRNNPSRKITPCHRVVAATGALTGYTFGGVSAKKKILMKEGVVFVGDKVDLKKSQWKK